VTASLGLLLLPSGQGSGNSMMVFMIQMVAIVGIVYFLMIRPKVQQEKQHKQRLSQIKRGDEIVTAGGIVAEVVHIKDDQLTIKSGESRLVVLRDRVSEVRTAKTAEAKSIKPADTPSS